MTFFYDLNKKIADLAKPAEQLNERSEKWIQKAVDPSHKGDLHKALHVPQGEKIPKGKIEKATHSKNAHLRHMAQFAKNVAKEDAVDEGFVDTVKQGAQAALGAIGQTLGHGSDEDMIKDLQKKAGVPVTGKVQPQQPGQQQGQQPMAEEGGEPMTAKQKAFAKLAPPEDKITFADKIAGAEKEAAEMVEHAKGEAEAIVAKAAEDTKALIKRREKMAEDKIAAAERGAIDELRAKTAAVAAGAAQTLIAAQHDASADKALVDEAIAGL